MSYHKVVAYDMGPTIKKNTLNKKLFWFMNFFPPQMSTVKFT